MTIRSPAWLADGFVRAPAVPVALAMLLGIALARAALPVWPWTAVACAAGAILLSIVAWRWTWIASASLFAAAFFGAIAATHLSLHRFHADDIGLYASEDARLCRLRLYLPNEPRLRTVGFGNRLPFPPKQTTLAEVREVLTLDGWRAASGSVLLQIHQPVSDLAAGQTIEVLARLERPGIAMNPGQFDWQRYYREQGIVCSVQVRRADAVTIVSRNPAPLLTRWREGCRAMLQRGFSKERSLDHALLAALVLGDYDPELRDVKDDFRRTGTGHHLAISGMHIAVVGGFVFVIVRLLGGKPRTCWIIGLVVVGLYGCAAMPSPPVLRAVILFAVAGGAFLCGRFAAAVHLLALTVAIMMALHPPDLFNAGFQLSFGTVLGLLLLSEPLAARLTREEQILLPEELDRLPRTARLIRWLDRRHLQVWTTGLAAWLVSMPLVAIHFTRLNPWQVVASILLAPLVMGSLIAGVVKIVGTFLFPSLAPTLATIAIWSTAWMRWLVDQLSRWVYADVPLAAPPMWLAILCWLSLVMLMRRWRTATMQIGVITLLLGTFAYMILGPYLFGSAQTLAAGQMRVTLFAVGAGQCVLVQQSGGRNVLIDCGSQSLSDLTNNVVVPALREYGVTRIDTIFISHANADHYSGVAEIADAYDVREIVVADGFERWARASATGETLLAELASLDLPPRSARPGDRIPLGRDATLDVLWPPPNARGLSANDSSLVLRLNKAGRSICFPGDIESAGMRGVMVGARADLLVAPHHGSGEDATAGFLEAASPAWIVSSNDRTLTGKQRAFDAAAAGRRLLRTHEYGAITITIEADGEMCVEGFVKSVE